MASAIPQATNAPRLSVAQFRIKDLLWMTLWVGVGLGALTPFLPEGTSERLVLLAELSMLLALFVVAAVSVSWQRRKIERQAGAVLLLVRTRKRHRPWLHKVLIGVPLALMLVLLVALRLFGGAPSLWLLLLIALNPALLLGRLFLPACWERIDSLEVCENGLIFTGLHFIPWKAVTGFAQAATKREQVVFQLGRADRMQFRIESDEQRQALTEFMQSRLAAS